MLPSITLALPLLSSFVAAVPTADSAVHIPITRRHRRWTRGNGELDMDVMHAMVDNIRFKFGIPTSSSSSAQGAELSRRQNGVGLTDVGFDASYVAPVTVGSASQSFQVVLDTGSSDLWLVAPGCNGCASSTPTFNPTSSSSFSATGNQATLQYGSGTAQGTLGSDTISLGGFTLSNQALTSVNTVTQDIINGPISGIMGMGFQGLSQFDQAPFWQNLASNGQLPSNEFSFFLARNHDRVQQNDDTNPGGVFTLGGTNSSLFQGNIDFQGFPSGQPSGFWLQTVTQLTLNGNNVNIGSSNLAAIDTGTTLIGGPTEAVQAFYQQIPGSSSAGGGLFVFPCDTTLNVSLSFGGPAWPINTADINFGQVSSRSNLCQGTLFDVSQGSQTSSSTPDWIIGDAFLKSVYTVFRASPAGVGFAQLSDAAGGSVGAPGSGTATTNTSGAAACARPTLLALLTGALVLAQVL